jgi:acyl carrier protein/NADP-dependent 3-hydroxy acid dehydrogenase YdfG
LLLSDGAAAGGLSSVLQGALSPAGDVGVVGVGLWDLLSGQKAGDGTDVGAGVVPAQYDAVVVFGGSRAGEVAATVEAEGASSIGRWLSLIGELCRMTKRVLFVDVSAAVAGAIRCAQMEYPRVEMVVASADPDLEVSAAVAQAVSGELSCWDGELEVSYRGGKRLAKRYAACSELSRGGGVIEGRGAYVITGGLGGLGLLTAKVLVRLGARRIVLVSRSGRVPYEGQGLEAELSWLQGESGADVRVVRCDVSDESAVSALLRDLRSEEGGVEGIVHAAGVSHYGLIRSGSAAAGCADVWDAKASSAWYLHKHTQEDDVKVFVCFSSISAAAGSSGLASYAAANSFLDYLINNRRRSGLPGLSVQWPAVSGIGMAASMIVASAESSEGHKDVGWCIDPSVVITVLENLLQGSFKEIEDGIVTVCPVSILSHVGHRVKRQFQTVQQLADRANREVVKRTEKRSSVEQKTVSTTRDRDQIQRILLDTISSLIGRGEVDPSLELSEMGLDSLGSMELAGRLSRELDMRVPPTILYSCPTIEDIVNFVSGKQMPSQVREAFNAPSARVADVESSVAVAARRVVPCTDGDYVSESPIFANYWAAQAPKMRLVLIVGTAQPTHVWYDFCSKLKAMSFDIHVVRLPGTSTDIFSSNCKHSQPYFTYFTLHIRSL